MFISRKKYEKLKFLAFHDVQTNCYNRNWIEIFLSKNTDEVINVAFIDINNLKLINDTLGHFAGDELINKIVKLLSQKSLVARWGGDEFICLIKDENVNDFESLCKNQKDFAYSIERNFTKKDFLQHLKSLDKNMYIQKQSQKNNT